MRLLAAIGVLAIVVAIVAAVFFFGGFYSVAGTQEDPAILKWALVKVRNASIARHATDRAPGNLGDPAFVSSKRIPADLNRLAWNSTTPYLSVLVAPGLAPARLVLDPDTGYFWLSCETATRSDQTSTALPLQARQLIRKYSCLHRP